MRAADHRRGRLIGALALAVTVAAATGGRAAPSGPTGAASILAEPALAQLREALIAERDGRATPAATARALIAAASVLGWPELAHDVALRYFHGDGLPRDLAAARAWWRRGAEAGLAEAQYDYGVLLAAGAGGPPDRAAARRWWRLAAAQGLAAARSALAAYPPTGDETTASPTDAVAVTPTGGAPQPAPPAAIATDGARWLRTRPPGAWTLQLASGASAEGLRRLLAETRLGLPAAVVPVRDHGRTLYTAVAGVFAHRDQAITALAALPQAARRFGPRVRRVRTLQAMLPPADTVQASTADH